MKITGCQIFPLPEPNKGVLGYARVSLDDELQLTGIRIYEGSHGLFVSYPNDPSGKGEDYRQFFFPTSRILRENIENTILDQFIRYKFPEYFVGDSKELIIRDIFKDFGSYAKDVRRALSNYLETI